MRHGITPNSVHSSGAKMKRIGLFVLLSLALVMGLHASEKPKGGLSKLDKKLQEAAKNGKGGTVQVIIQTHSPAGLDAKLAKVNGKKVKVFNFLNAVAVEIPVDSLSDFANDSDNDAISSDEDVHGHAVPDGIEAPNSSSGALAAIKQFHVDGNGIGVAVIDSGIGNVGFALNNVVYSVDFTNSNLVSTTTSNLVSTTTSNLVSTTTSSLVPNTKGDPYGHGTHVAGIVAGGGEGSGPGKDYSGVAPDVRLVDLRVLNNSGAGKTSDVIAAIEWAIANRNIKGSDGKPLNIRVINLSLGHLPYESADTDPLAVACRKAVQNGIVVVASAGNYGKDDNGNKVFGAISTPGIEPSVITVGAVTTWGTPSRSDDVVASYSSRGPTIDGIIKPDISAPGSRVVSTMAPKNYIITNNPGLQVNKDYMMLSGSSMSAG